MSVCENWYNSCQLDSVCGLDSEFENLDFCLEDEEGGIVMQEIEGMDASLFCKKMGFKVNAAPFCYDGVPLAETLSL